MTDKIKWDGGKIEKMREIKGTGYKIINIYSGEKLPFRCEKCANNLYRVSVNFMPPGIITGVKPHLEANDWVWCQDCEERRLYRSYKEVVFQIIFFLIVVFVSTYFLFGYTHSWNIHDLFDFFF